MVILARAARVLIAVALLAAQQAALGHQIWHLHMGTAHGVADPAAAGDRGAPAPQERLCDLHASLGAVLGALDCSGSAEGIATAPASAFRSADSRSAGTPAPPPASRGPPSNV